MRQNRVHVRLLVVAGVALLWTTGVFARLSYLQLIRHSEYLARAQRQQQRTVEITPRRGIIYDRNMRPLAMSVPVKSAFAVPAEIADEPLAARLLSGVLNISGGIGGEAVLVAFVCVDLAEAAARKSRGGRGAQPQKRLLSGRKTRSEERRG